MTPEPIAPAHTDKIDPDEPWRYTCPDCNSQSVKKLKHNGTRKRGEYRANGWGRLAAKRSREKFYTCQNCQERKNRVWDKKREALLKP